jgi:hypothetical protein
MRTLPRPCRDSSEARARDSQDGFPLLAKHHRRDDPHREVGALELGLDLMLEGVKDQHEH